MTMETAEQTSGGRRLAVERWTARRKAEVVRAVARGRLTATEASIIYALSAEELGAWAHALAENGLVGLMVTKRPIKFKAKGSQERRGQQRE